MGKYERINEIYQELRSRGIVHNKRDFSDLVGYNYNNFTLAMKGSEVYLTDKLMQRVEDAYAYILENPQARSNQYKPMQQIKAVVPNPPAIPPELVQMISDFTTIIRSQQETILGQAKAIERLTKSSGMDSKTNAI